MSEPIRFDDGAAYETFMGIWSRLAGDIFLDWIAPAPGQRWIDVGCGNAAFTERLAAVAAPAEIVGIDPSEGQLAYARTRLPKAQFHQGDAMALPFTDDRFDAAVMALVIFFVPDAAKGVAEMVRVVRPGGQISAYAWDMQQKPGFPARIIGEQLRDLGLNPPLPPSIEAATLDGLSSHWIRGGLRDVETRTIEVKRVFASFDAFWTAMLDGPSMGQMLRQLPDQQATRVKENVRAQLSDEGGGRVGHRAKANAVKGIKPA